MSKVTLVDGDIIPYACGFAAQETTYESEDGEVHSTPTQVKAHIKKHGLGDTYAVFVETEPVSHALRLAKNQLANIKNSTKADELRVFLTGGSTDPIANPNFRIETATVMPYKGNRTQAKPLHWQAIRDYLVQWHCAEITDGYEADDALGINQTEDTCIATIDKDLDMIPGAHYNWNKVKYYHVTEAEALRFFYIQLLTGDSVDNIPGLPGIGAKKAAAHLAKCVTEEDYFWRALCLYERHAVKDKVTGEMRLAYKEPHKAMVEMGQLLWIMRKEYEPWEPPF